MIRYVDYEISPNMNLRVQGSEYTYTENDKNSKSYIKAYYQKIKMNYIKCHLNQVILFFAGKGNFRYDEKNTRRDGDVQRRN